MKKTQTIKLQIEVPVVRRTKTTIPITYNVVGMMQQIKRCMPDKNKQDLLDEYAKFYLMHQAGLSSYPIIEKATSPEVA